MKEAAIAYERCKDYTALERNRFMAAFAKGAKAGQLGSDTYDPFSRAWKAEDSVFLAGYLEGIASTRYETGREYNVKRYP